MEVNTMTIAQITQPSKTDRPLVSNSNFGFARGSGLSIDASRAKVANPSLTKEAEMTSPLRFDDLQSILHQRIDQLPDHRKEGPNTQYRIRDAA